MKKVLIPILVGFMLSATAITIKAKPVVKPDGYSKKQEKVVTVKQVVIKDKKIINRSTVSNSENKKARDDIKKEIILQQKQLAKENKERMAKIVKERKAKKGR